MPDAFARFNFFSTDAAYDLAYDQNSASAIKTAFIRLALGDEADRLNRRLDDFAEDFRKRCTRLASDIAEGDALDSKLAKDVEELERESATLGGDVGEIGRIAVGRFGIVGVALSAEAQRETLHSKSLLAAKIVGSVDWLDNLTGAALADQERLLESTRATVETLSIDEHDLRKRDSQLGEKHEEAQQDLQTLRQASALSGIRDIELLSNLQRELTELASVAEILHRHGEITAQLRGLRDEIGEAAQSLFESIGEMAVNQRHLEDLRQQIRGAEAVLSDSTRLLSSIRAHGIEYLDLTKSEGTCPMCGTKHTPGVLRSLLEEEIDTRDDDVVRLQGEARKLEIRLLQVQKAATLRAEVSRVAAAIGQDPPKQDSLPTVIVWAESVAGLVSSRLERWKTLNELKRTLGATGMTVGQASALRALIAERFNVQLSFASKSAIETLLADREAVLKQISAEWAEAKTSLKKVQEDIREKLSESLPGLYETQHMISVLAERRHASADALATYLNLTQGTNIDDRVDLRTLATELSSGLREIETAVAFSAKIDQSSRLLQARRKEREENVGVILERRTELDRCAKAQKVIAGLRESQGIERHLQNFVAAYRDSILAIFERIHSPKEFIGLELGSEQDEGEILLKRENGQEARLSQISTGQRSALALSVFLALNASAKSKLNLILIDDPIAHIDDFNGLSFIDYLRNSVLSGTQVLVATANLNLRRLIEMKFKFLGVEDFQILEFPEKAPVSEHEADGSHRS
jgi:chromosome segregation protein